MSLSKQEFTNAGRSMLGRAQNSEVLTITKIVVGDGIAAQPSDLWPLTDLIGLKLNVDISAKLDYGDGKMLVEGSFTSDEALAPFYLREVGVMAHCASEADRLYSVANVFADPPDYVDPAAPTIQAFKIKLVIDRIPTAQLVVQIGPSENVIGENVGAATVGPGPYKEAVGNVLRFKRFVEGTGIRVTEDAGANTITIAVRQLETNVDLYVPESNPDAPNPDVAFPTIQDAHDYLLQFVIPPDKFATINVYSGNFTVAVPTVFSHPNASQIKVLGKPLIQRSCTGNLTTTGTPPNSLTVTCTVSGGTSGITDGDVVAIYNAGDGRLETTGYVTAHTGTTVSIRIHSQSPPPASVPAVHSLGTTKLVIFPTQFRSDVAAGINMFDCPHGIERIKNFALRSTQTATTSGTGISVQAFGKVENIAVVGFAFGLGVGGGILWILPAIFCSQCQIGAQTSPSGDILEVATADFDKVVFSGNAVYGLWLLGSYTSAMELGGPYCKTYVIGNPTGIRLDSGRLTHGVSGTFPSGDYRGGVVCVLNVNGIVATFNGTFLTALNSRNLVEGNLTWNAKADTGGMIGVINAPSIPPNSTLDPDNALLGPSGGYLEYTL